MLHWYLGRYLQKYDHKARNVTFGRILKWFQRVVKNDNISNWNLISTFWKLTRLTTAQFETFSLQKSFLWPQWKQKSRKNITYCEFFFYFVQIRSLQYSFANKTTEKFFLCNVFSWISVPHVCDLESLLFALALYEISPLTHLVTYQMKGSWARILVYMFIYQNSETLIFVVTMYRVSQKCCFIFISSRPKFNPI